MTTERDFLLLAHGMTIRRLPDGVTAEVRYPAGILRFARITAPRGTDPRWQVEIVIYEPTQTTNRFPVSTLERAIDMLYEDLSKAQSSSNAEQIRDIRQRETMDNLWAALVEKFADNDDGE